jgi:hypothetical protein
MIFTLALSGVLVLASPSAQSVEDFFPPAAALTPEERAVRAAVSNPDSVQIVRGGVLADPVYSAEIVQDAFALATRDLIETGSGTSVVSLANNKGLAILWAGEAIYSKDAENPDFVRDARRRAYQIAYIRAQATAARNLGTRTVDQMNLLASTAVEVLDDSDTRLAEVQKSVTSITEYASTCLKAATVWEVSDDPASGVVTVVLASTPKSRSLLRRSTPFFCEAESLPEGLDAIFVEVRNGVMPPVGGRTIMVPSTGELAWVAFGADTILSGGDESGRMRISKKKAELRALASLADLMNGTEVSSRSSLVDTSELANGELELLQGLESVGSDRLRACNSALAASSELTEEIASVSKGLLPPGVVTKFYVNQELGWVYAVVVYTPSISEELRLILSGKLDRTNVKKAKDQGAYDPKVPGPTGKIGGE